MIEIFPEIMYMAEINLSNARDPEQIERMKELARTGQCHFCRIGFELRHKAPIIHETAHWFVAANNFPYPGSIHHYLIVPQQHVTRTVELTPEARVELFDVQGWLEKNLELVGSSLISASALLVRSGDMSYTSATLDHLHFHLIVGAKKISDEPNKLEDLVIVPVGFKQK